MGRDAVAKALPSVFARLVDRLPGGLIESLREQYTRIAPLDKEVSNIERRLREWYRDDESCRRISAIPGVGLLTATATVAAMGDPGAFSSGREFAAWLGLVPRQTGTGGRVKLLGISKRGDRYLRTLFIHGARSVLMTSKTPPAWVANLAKRRPLMALANKMARTLWALLAHQRAFQSGYVSRPA